MTNDYDTEGRQAGPFPGADSPPAHGSLASRRHIAQEAGRPLIQGTLSGHKLKKGRKVKDRVLVFGQNEVLCEGLKSIVLQVRKLRLAGAVTRLEDLRESALLQNPEMALLGLSDGCERELEVVRSLTDELPNLAILILDNHPTLKRLTWFLLAGARGYFPIEANLRDLLAHLDFTNPELFTADARLAGRFRSQGDFLPRDFDVEPVLHIQKLTPKERELLNLLSEGKTNQDIAESLDVSLSTVKNLSHRLFNKLGVKNRLQAVATIHRRRSDEAALT